MDKETYIKALEEHIEKRNKMIEGLIEICQGYNKAFKELSEAFDSKNK